jgi:nicotinamide-nucleotide amidase
MNAEILAVGTELLMGQIANTNAQYISGRLPEVGMNVYYHSVVGDNPKRLKECLAQSLSRSDVVIMTGGLGPTQDDLTKETVAEAFGRKMVLDQESLELIKNYFSRINRPMVDSNTKQAYFPEGSIIMQNNRGTAPGCIVEKDDKVIIMLPGPPSEMKPMFEESVMTYFKNKADYKIVSKFLRIFGIGESSLEDQLIDLINKQTNPTLATYAKEGEVTLRITAKCGKEEDGEAVLAPVLDEVRRRIGDCIYTTDDKNLEQVVAQLLIENNMSISLAESCTGGLVAARLTDNPGISKVLDRAAVTYSNRAKTEELGVNPVTLSKYGAVSRQTAEEMATGIRMKAKSALGLSVTGIAGPDGGTSEKPVGLVYIALSYERGLKTKELKLGGTRTKIRNITVLHALDMIRRHVTGLE